MSVLVGQAFITRRGVIYASLAGRAAWSALRVAVRHVFPLWFSLSAGASLNAALGSMRQTECVNLVCSTVPNVSAGRPAITAKMATSWSMDSAFHNASLVPLARRTVTEQPLVFPVSLPAIDVTFTLQTALSVCPATTCMLLTISPIPARGFVLAVVCSRVTVASPVWLDAWPVCTLRDIAPVAIPP